MEQTIDFLQHFSPSTTPPELVSEYYEDYVWRKSHGAIGTLCYDTFGESKAAKTNRARVKVVKNCTCPICGYSHPLALEIHHYVPRSKGGSNDIENLFPLCKNCHSLVHYVMQSNDFNSVRELYSRHQYKTFKGFVNYKR